MRNLLTCILLLVSVLMPRAETTMIRPAPLHPGDTIAIIAPANSPDTKKVHRYAERLRERGYHVEFGENIFNRHGSYSAVDSLRRKDLLAALTEPSVKALIAARGGYGAVRILQGLDSVGVQENAKWLVGFSDISALHSALNARGVMSIHGPMATSSTAETAERDFETLMSVLQGDSLLYKVEPDTLNHCGAAQGRLVGGNMSVIMGLFGTPYSTVAPGTILFIEDVAEPIYKVERMLYQLKLSGVLAQLNGLVVGEFTKYDHDSDYPGGMYGMIADAVADYGYPVIFGFEAGHGGVNHPLVLGAETYIDVTDQGAWIRQ